jgi:hypothetical protein
MKFGAEPKKVAILGGLLLLAAFLLYRNVFSGNPGPETRTKPPRVPSAIAPPPDLTPVPATTSRPNASGRRSATTEFRPPYKQKAAIDPGSIDPRLRLDLLAKVQSVEPQGATRNVFQFGAAEMPAIKEPKPIIPKTQEQIAKELAQRNTPPPGPVTPPPPPITLKYYGYIAQRADGRKRAFFLDGDDILVAAEGEVLKRRYKVVRIGVNSAIVEDTQFNNTQTIPLQEEAAG